MAAEDSSNTSNNTRDVQCDLELREPLLETRGNNVDVVQSAALSGSEKASSKNSEKSLNKLATVDVQLAKGLQLPDATVAWGAQKRQMETWLAVAILELLILFPFMLAVPGVVVLVFPPIVVGAAAATRYLSHGEAPESFDSQAKSVRWVMSLSMAACLLNLIPLAILGFGFVFFIFACPGLEDPVGECWSTAVYFGLSEVVAGWYSWLSFVIGSHARTVSIMMDPVSAGLVRIV